MASSRSISASSSLTSVLREIPREGDQFLKRWEVFNAGFGAFPVHHQIHCPQRFIDGIATRHGLWLPMSLTVRFVTRYTACTRSSLKSPTIPM